MKTYGNKGSSIQKVSVLSIVIELGKIYTIPGIFIYVRTRAAKSFF